MSFSTVSAECLLQNAENARTLFLYRVPSRDKEDGGSGGSLAGCHPPPPTHGKELNVNIKTRAV